ncbi:MAG: hypothetical protein N3A54_01240 [Patescibacteria group bacterium]|nr:hypothetical protein [Patescibacteria group bacterium]
MKRNDVHTPSNLVPADYEFVGFLNFREDEMVNYEYCLYWREVVRQHMMVTGGMWSQHEHGGSCDVCGNANAIYMVAFHHKPSNTYIRVGRECAEKLSEQAALGLDEYSQNIRGEGLRRKRLQEAEAWLKNVGLGRAWEIFTEMKENRKRPPEERNDKYYAYEYSTLYDIVDKLVVYGELTQRQEEYLVKLVKKIDKAEEPAPAREIPPVQAGRQTISGKIVGIKFDEVWRVNKIMVETESGQKYWGTFPVSSEVFEDGSRATVYSPQKGMEITFTATVTPSDKDSGMGFFSHPRKSVALRFKTA